MGLNQTRLVLPTLALPLHTGGMLRDYNGTWLASRLFHVRDVMSQSFRFLLGLSHFDLVLLFDTGEGLMLFDDDIGLATLNKETSIF